MIVITRVSRACANGKHSPEPSLLAYENLAVDVGPRINTINIKIAGPEMSYTVNLDVNKTLICCQFKTRYSVFRNTDALH